MSLIAHYKLDGNTNDSVGGNHLTTVTALSNPSGKLGGCYDFTANQRILGSGLSFQHTVSVSGWGYATSNTTNMMLFSFNSSSFSGPDLYFTNSTICWNIGDSANNPFKNNGVSVVQPSLNTWHHYVLVNDALKNKTDLYVDGVYYGTAIYRSTYQVNAGFTIGNYIPTSTGYAWRGSIDDVRIYDHALSLKEVQELAKAKVLHYTFDDFQEPTENLLSSGLSGYSAFNTSNWNGATLTTNGTSDLNTPIMVYDTSGTSYTYTHDYILDDDLSDLSGKVVTFSVFIRRRNSAANGQIRIYDNVSGYSYFPVNVETYFKRFEITKTIGTNPTRIFVMIDNTGGGVYEFHSPQLEAKAYATPFVNGTRTGVVRDQSTQGNDVPLTLANTPKWVEGGMVGKGCYEFDGVNDEVSAAPSCGNVSGDKASFCAWVYHTQRASTYSTIIHKSMQYTISVCSSTGGLTYSDSTAWSYASFGCHGLIPLNEWTHIAAVRNGSFVTLYINGTAVITKTAGSTINTTSNPLFIGAYKDTTYANHFWKGQLDDVRIYATALTDEQVLELYQTRASLDDKGNFYA